MILYSTWKQEYRPLLETLSDKKVLVLFSGGKDSSLSLHLMARAGKEYGFKPEPHGTSFPRHRYTESEKNRLAEYWQEQGIAVTWHDPGQNDDFIKDAENPCIPCQDLRKQMLMTRLPAIVPDWNSLVIVTSYSLWDLVGYTLEYLLSGLFSRALPGGSGGTGERPQAAGDESEKRFHEIAQRFYPLLKMKEGYTIFRPLLRLNGCDIVNKIDEKAIPILTIPCEYRGFRPKRVFESYYDQMGLRFNYEQVFAFARNALNLPDLSSYTGIEMKEYLGRIF
jgi:tRNA(Ile)-lysidine synthase TilS/MesJ